MTYGDAFDRIEERRKRLGNERFERAGFFILTACSGIAALALTFAAGKQSAWFLLTVPPVLLFNAAMAAMCFRYRCQKCRDEKLAYDEARRCAIEV